MSYCQACQSLRGQPGDIDPHDNMRGEAHILRNDGVIEVYTCRGCGAKWERFVGARTLGMQSGSWKTLSSS